MLSNTAKMLAGFTQVLLLCFLIFVIREGLLVEEKGGISRNGSGIKKKTTNKTFYFFNEGNDKKEMKDNIQPDGP